jgi:hypothetical protein
VELNSFNGCSIDTVVDRPASPSASVKESPAPATAVTPAKLPSLMMLPRSICNGIPRILPAPRPGHHAVDLMSPSAQNGDTANFRPAGLLRWVSLPQPNRDILSHLRTKVDIVLVSGRPLSSSRLPSGSGRKTAWALREMSRSRISRRSPAGHARETLRSTTIQRRKSQGRNQSSALKNRGAVPRGPERLFMAREDPTKDRRGTIATLVATCSDKYLSSTVIKWPRLGKSDGV